MEKNKNLLLPEATGIYEAIRRYEKQADFEEAAKKDAEKFLDDIIQRAGDENPLLRTPIFRNFFTQGFVVGCLHTFASQTEAMSDAYDEIKNAHESAKALFGFNNNKSCS